MSSPLDGRIRAIAREEATTLLGVGIPEALAAAGADTDRVTALEQQLAELGERLARLEQAPTAEAVPKQRRTSSRKPAESAEPSE